MTSQTTEPEKKTVEYNSNKLGTSSSSTKQGWKHQSNKLGGFFKGEIANLNGWPRSVKSIMRPQRQTKFKRQIMILPYMLIAT